MFDRNKDTRIDDKELKQMCEYYAKLMGRKLNPNWWEEHMKPAIK